MIGRWWYPIAGGTSSITEAQNGQDIVLSIDIVRRKAEERLLPQLKTLRPSRGWLNHGLKSLMRRNPAALRTLYQILRAITALMIHSTSS